MSEFDRPQTAALAGAIERLALRGAVGSIDQIAVWPGGVASLSDGLTS